MERTLRVTGKGRLAVRPDTVRLILSLNGRRMDYAETLQASAELTARLKETAEQQGFRRDEVKTLRFGVDTEYEYYDDPRDRSRKSRFAGYSFEHRMKLEFAADHERLGRLLYAFAHCAARPEIGMEYTVSDPEAAKDALLKQAVQDSKRKAGVLAEAAGVRLGGILTVDYSWGQIEMVARPMQEMMLKETRCADGCGSYAMDIDPDDIDLEETVTVVWEIG